MRDEALDVIPRPDCPSSVDGRLASAAARYVGGLADLPAACARCFGGAQMESAAHPLSSTIVGIVGIMDLPDNVIAAAMSMVVSAGGAVKASKTTPLITINEGLQAMRKGGDVAASYRPPGT